MPKTLIAVNAKDIRIRPYSFIRQAAIDQATELAVKNMKPYPERGVFVATIKAPTIPPISPISFNFFKTPPLPCKQQRTGQEAKRIQRYE